MQKRCDTIDGDFIPEQNYFGKEIHSLFGADEAQLDDNKLVEKSLHFS